MKVLIKIGGTLLDSLESRQRLAGEIGAVSQRGVNTVVVHGGGKQMTRFLEERGVQSQFVNGLRVTTPEVVDGVLMVFAGTVNQQLVAAFASRGVRAVGLTGMDAYLTEAEQLSPELGLVGRPVRSDPALLNLLTANGYVPVVACVGGDRSGQFFNVNADQMAVACAAAFEAEKLLFLTDVDGVRDSTGAICRSLSIQDCETLIASEVATGGMRAKLAAGMDALRSGIPTVAIAPGAVSGVIDRLLNDEAVGTRLVAAFSAGSLQ